MPYTKCHSMLLVFITWFLLFMGIFLGQCLSRSSSLTIEAFMDYLSVDYGISSLLSGDTMWKRFFLFRFCDLGVYGVETWFYILLIYSVNAI